MNNNMPMTLKEVKELKSGEKVYLKQYKTLISEEVSCVFARQIVFVNNIRKYLFSNYGKTWLLYRSKDDTEKQECRFCQREEDWLDATAELLYKGESDRDSIVMGVDEDGQVYIYPLECVQAAYKPKYCPECGRKLHD